MNELFTMNDLFAAISTLLVWLQRVFEMTIRTPLFPSLTFLKVCYYFYIIYRI